MANRSRLEGGVRASGENPGEPRKTAVVTTKVRVPAVPSMTVDRLDSRLDLAWSRRLGLVIAPAGSGKTSLLARLAGRARGPVGWYRAEGWDSDETTLIRHLEAALAPGLPGIGRRWHSMGDAANALGRWQGGRILLVVDDLHTLEGTEAEAALERLIEYAPPTLLIVAASRVPPRFNLPRLRVSSQLLELTSDDLRFRSWEVERLFRDYYGEPLPPEDLARLARRTEGWAAGLQLFHLATHGRPAEERRRLLRELGVSSRLVREMRDYLARNVLDQLPADLRDFLVETSVLGKLNAPLCNRLLGRTDSDEVLDDLERRRLFTNRLAEDGWYRYHEVLRSHLQAVLLSEVGAVGLRERFCTAGTLLAASGALPEGVEAFCRGEDWGQVNRLLGGNGREVAEGPGAWLDVLPTAIISNDPWLLLANARVLRANGRIGEAVDTYRRAETAFGPSEAGTTCRAERLALSHWLDQDALASDGTPGTLSLLRAAVARDPLSAAQQAGRVGTLEGHVFAGLAALAGGHTSRARRDLMHAAGQLEVSRLLGIIASLGAGIAGLLMGQRQAVAEVEAAVAAAEDAGVDWLARMGRASLALGGTEDSIREAESVAGASRQLGDRWGEAIAELCRAWGSAMGNRPIGDLQPLVELLRSLEAGTLEAWALGLTALAAAQADDAENRDAARIAEAAEAAERAARAFSVPPASLCASLALAVATSSESRAIAGEHLTSAEAAAREMGLLAPPSIGLLAWREIRAPAAVPSHDPAAWNGADRRGHTGVSSAPSRVVAVPPLAIRLLGGFRLELEGRPVDVSAIRPRARALLRLLCLHAGAPVHHETIEAAMWPDAERDASARNLHVAIASLRRVLEPGASRGSFQLLRRDGDAYRFALPEGAVVDLLQFEAALVAGRRASERGDEAGARRAYEAAHEAYAGELLPEDGPADWVADRREQARLGAVEAAQRLAEIYLRSGDSDGAARVANAGLRIERYHDPLWRLLIRSRDEAGDQGAATRARSGYDAMLAELDVAPGTALAQVGT